MGLFSFFFFVFLFFLLFLFVFLLFFSVVLLRHDLFGCSCCLGDPADWLLLRSGVLGRGFFGRGSSRFGRLFLHGGWLRLGLVRIGSWGQSQRVAGASAGWLLAGGWLLDWGKCGLLISVFELGCNGVDLSRLLLVLLTGSELLLEVGLENLELVICRPVVQELIGVGVFVRGKHWNQAELTTTDSDLGVYWLIKGRSKAQASVFVLQPFGPSASSHGGPRNWLVLQRTHLLVFVHVHGIRTVGTELSQRSRDDTVLS